MSQPGIEPVTSCSLERTVYLLSYLDQYSKYEGVIKKYVNFPQNSDELLHF